MHGLNEGQKIAFETMRDNRSGKLAAERLATV